MEQPRLDAHAAAPNVYRVMLQLEAAVRHSTLEPALLELVKMRASQINGCAFCLDMHSKDARARGETEQRLYLLNAWRETNFYTPRERAALAWTDSLTLISENHAPDSVYAEVRPHFNDEELATLTFAIGAINVWNRLSIGFRTEAGTWQPKASA